MQQLRVLLLSLSLFLVSWPCYSEVVLTDQQAEELDQTLDQLETTLKMQDEEIATLKQQNEELQTLSENKQELLNEQDEEIKTLRSSYKKQNIFSILRNVLISICSCGVGILIGLIL